MGYLDQESARRAEAYPTADDARLIMWSAHQKLVSLGWHGQKLPRRQQIVHHSLCPVAWSNEKKVLSILQDASHRLSELHEDNGLRDEVVLGGGGRVLFVVKGMASHIQSMERRGQLTEKLVLMWRPL
jgi:hypothetical protein